MDRAKANLAVSLDVWDIFEEGNDNGEDQHEADSEEQGPRQRNAAAAQRLLHVKVKAQLHHDSPVQVTQSSWDADIACVRTTKTTGTGSACQASPGATNTLYRRKGGNTTPPFLQRLRQIVIYGTQAFAACSCG